MISAKIMLLGDIGVGKTSLARRFVFDKFEADYKTTIGVDVLTHDVTLGADGVDEVVRLVLWDTDGDFGSRIFETVYLAGASGAIVVADASRPSTIAKAARLAEGFEKHFPGRSLSRLVNKIDLLPEHFRLSEEDDLTYVSARSGAGVDAAFLALATTLWRRRR